MVSGPFWGLVFRSGSALLRTFVELFGSAGGCRKSRVYVPPIRETISAFRFPTTSIADKAEGRPEDGMGVKRTPPCPTLGPARQPPQRISASIARAEACRRYVRKAPWRHRCQPRPPHCFQTSYSPFGTPGAISVHGSFSGWGMSSCPSLAFGLRSRASRSRAHRDRRSVCCRRPCPVR